MKMRQNLEGDQDVERRIQSLTSFLQQCNTAQTIVIVCHGDLIWWLTRKMNHEGRGRLGKRQKTAKLSTSLRTFLGPIQPRSSSSKAKRLLKCGPIESSTASVHVYTNLRLCSIGAGSLLHVVQKRLSRSWKFAFVYR